jgi:ketosteroid isomerase-like protein
MVTGDVVVVHGDGRCIRGREELKADFLKAFESFLVEQRVTNPEIVTRGDWGFEIAGVESTLTPLHGGEAIRVVTTTMVALRRQPDGTWKIARVVGLLG